MLASSQPQSYECNFHCLLLSLNWCTVALWGQKINPSLQGMHSCLHTLNTSSGRCLLCKGDSYIHVQTCSSLTKTPQRSFVTLRIRRKWYKSGRDLTLSFQYSQIELSQVQCHVLLDLVWVLSMWSLLQWSIVPMAHLWDWYSVWCESWSCVMVVCELGS